MGAVTDFCSFYVVSKFISRYIVIVTECIYYC